MEPKLERATYDVEEQHWWYRGRREVIAGTVARMGLPAGARILDAGCGSGRNMALLAPYGSVTGVESSQEGVDAARARGVGEAMRCSLLEPLPLPRESFDLVVCLDVLEHLEDDAGVLRELRRVVRAGGRLLVTVPAHPLLWSDHDDLAHHVRRYTRATLRDVALGAGWAEPWMTGFNVAMLAPIAALRLAQRLRPPGATQRSDLERSPAWADALLFHVLRAEAAWLRRGHAFPAGLSLLATFTNGPVDQGRTRTDRLGDVPAS